MLCTFASTLSHSAAAARYKTECLVQATELKSKLAVLAKLDGALWVSSPLTRAIETLLLSCPKAHLIGTREQQDVVDSANIKACAHIVILVVDTLHHLERSWDECDVVHLFRWSSGQSSRSTLSPQVT